MGSPGTASKIARSAAMTGRHWTMAPMPDTGQDADVRIRILAHELSEIMRRFLRAEVESLWSVVQPIPDIAGRWLRLSRYG